MTRWRACLLFVLLAIPEILLAQASAPAILSSMSRTSGTQGATVSITFTGDDHDRIIVTDNGEGIPSHHLDRLFERFYRVDRARSRDLGGTGLGLAIVKHLARSHGGEVSVRSQFGEGSEFTIELPRQA